MRKYDKEFKEEAVKLSDEVGIKQAAAQLGVALLRRSGSLSAVGMIFHSDRGSQFASTAFRNALARHGAIQSMSGTGRCYDNARMESFFATLKKEKLYKIQTEQCRWLRSKASCSGTL